MIIPIKPSLASISSITYSDQGERGDRALACLARLDQYPMYAVRVYSRVAPLYKRNTSSPFKVFVPENPTFPLCLRATMSFHLYVVSPMSTQDLVHPEETKRSSTLPSGSPYIESHTVPPTSTTRQNGMSKPRDISIAPDMTEP